MTLSKLYILKFDLSKKMKKCSVQYCVFNGIFVKVKNSIAELSFILCWLLRRMFETAAVLMRKKKEEVYR